MKRIRVYNYRENRYQYGIREGDKVIKVRPGKIDTDNNCIEDNQGYRYYRRICHDIKDWWYFEMI